ncbi:MAG: pyridoxal-phosphate dependent enzyme [Saprospiraceae bacterium]
MIARSPSPVQLVPNHPGIDAGIALYLKRDDLLHPTVSGNKWRKLEPIIQLIQNQHYMGLLSYGGPFSNHLQAVAAAGRAYGFPTVGVVRGKAADLSNPTLAQARLDGMQLLPVTKQDYDRWKDAGAKNELAAQFPAYYHLPEGGATPGAAENCRLIAEEIQEQLSADRRTQLVVCVPAGTGCTAAGLVAGLGSSGDTLVFPAVNYGVDESSIRHFLPDFPESACRFIRDYTFGGFAVYRPELIDFVGRFQAQTGVLLDPIYTAKMMFGIYDLLGKGAFEPGSVVVALHTGGLQGWAGFRERFGMDVLFTTE